MIIQMDELVQVIATALDVVEAQLLGASTNHGKRIAVLCAAMGRYCGMSEAELSTLTTCALLHDNALTEYILEEYGSSKEEQAKDRSAKHCIYGQRNVDKLPLPTSAEGIVLYHHERADGKGPLSKTAAEIPLAASLIAIADGMDVNWHLQTVPVRLLSKIKDAAVQDTNTLYAPKATAAFLAVMDEELLKSLGDERINRTAKHIIPKWEIDSVDGELLELSDLAARIIDYKSNFTREHTTQIANRSWVMSHHYGYSRDERDKLYLAAALHDIGKLYTPSEVLEKPGKLTDEEYQTITDHVRYTLQLLRQVHGFEQICEWASNHHEKLDGSGYPRQLKSNQMDFNSRLLVCLDIYQAVSEERPYHPERSHEETMPILYSMAKAGKIDLQIVEDLDAVMVDYTAKDIRRAREILAY
ncbi:MAG: HD-GYP domain-containing protein [Lachnospiraceae bacterium]